MQTEFTSLEISDEVIVTRNPSAYQMDMPGSRTELRFGMAS